MATRNIWTGRSKRFMGSAGKGPNEESRSELSQRFRWARNWNYARTGARSAAAVKRVTKLGVSYVVGVQLGYSLLDEALALVREVYSSPRPRSSVFST